MGFLQCDASNRGHPDKVSEKLANQIARSLNEPPLHQCESNLNLFLIVKLLIQLLIFHNKDIYTARNIKYKSEL